MNFCSICWLSGWIGGFEGIGVLKAAVAAYHDPV